MRVWRVPACMGAHVWRVPACTGVRMWCVPACTGALVWRAPACAGAFVWRVITSRVAHACVTGASSKAQRRSSNLSETVTEGNRCRQGQGHQPEPGEREYNFVEHVQW